MIDGLSRTTTVLNSNVDSSVRQKVILRSCAVECVFQCPATARSMDICKTPCEAGYNLGCSEIRYSKTSRSAGHKTLRRQLRVSDVILFITL